jgi:HEAT repeat protein
MKATYGRGLITMSVLTVLALSLSTLLAAPSEDKLIADLGSPNAGTVISALANIESHYPTGTNAFPAMKKLLTDPRPKVMRKAARVLGVLHAPVDKTDIANICVLLKSNDADTLTDGLKSLRGLNAPQAVPDILPLLDFPNSHIKRDACRTLAVLGNRDLIPKIEPLLKDPEPAVQKDANNAIVALRLKP